MGATGNQIGAKERNPDGVMHAPTTHWTDDVSPPALLAAR
jgi:hypothetical protein